MVAIAVAGSFIIGVERLSPNPFCEDLSRSLIVGLALTYLGVLQTAGTDFEKFGNLERVQSKPQDLATSAESGFGEDLDVSTTGGAIAALPIGFSYLMFAPFPWQVSSFRQAITLPEMLVWWAFDSASSERALVYNKKSPAQCDSDSDFYTDADDCLFYLSGQCRHGVSTAHADTGFSVYFYRRRLDALAGEKGKTEASVD